MIREKIMVQVEPDLAELAASYLEEKRADLSKLDEALRTSDFKLFERYGHQMKGIAESLGFLELTTVGIQLEDYAVKQDIEEIGKLIYELGGYLEKVELNIK